MVDELNVPPLLEEPFIDQPPQPDVPREQLQVVIPGPQVVVPAPIPLTLPRAINPPINMYYQQMIFNNVFNNHYSFQLPQPYHPFHFPAQQMPMNFGTPYPQPPVQIYNYPQHRLEPVQQRFPPARLNLVRLPPRSRNRNEDRFGFTRYQKKILKEEFKRDCWLKIRDGFQLSYQLGIPFEKINDWFSTERARIQKSVYLQLHKF